MNNLATAYEEYVAQNINCKQIIANLNTALIRYTLPELGFVIPERSAKRFHPNDIEMAIKFASQFTLDEHIAIYLSEAQEKILLNAKISLSNKRQQKKNLKKFIEYIKSFQKITKPSITTKNKRAKLRNTILDLSYIESSKIRKKNKTKISLSLDPQDYPGDINSNKRETKRIKKEIDEFSSFLLTIQNSKFSRRSEIDNLKIILGWLYIKQQSLKEVGLKKLIPVCNIYPKIREFKSHNDYYIAKGEKEQEIKDIAKKVIDFVKDLFAEYQITTKGTRSKYIQTLVNVAKNNYKNITNEDDNENYEDILVIRRLRIFRNKIPKDTKKITISLPTWDVIISCLKELKRRTDLTHYEHNEKKTKSAEAKGLQNFLILGMFTLVPPSRQRVIRELRIGETIKHGAYKNGVFIAKDKLDCPKEAKYYIHLQPEDYKTGYKYGEWLAEFPDQDFDDGTTFYQYLDKWIYEGFRDKLLAEETHNYLFLKEQKSIPLEGADMYSKIRTLFNSTIRQKISPHQLRTIYRTYLEDIGSNQQILNSSAFWMRHSPEIAREVYTKQSLDNKLRPGQKMMSKINSELLNAPHISSSSS